jgi:hypothetical protein
VQHPVQPLRLPLLLPPPLLPLMPARREQGDAQA